MPEIDHDKLVYYSRLLGAADAVYSSAKYKVNLQKRFVALTKFNDGPIPIDWTESELLVLDVDELENKATKEAGYAELAKAASNAKNYGKWEKSFKRWLRNEQPLSLLYSKKYKVVSNPRESEGDFRARLQVIAHERRDVELGKLRKKYDAKTAVQERKLLRARQKLEKEHTESEQSKLDSYVSIGSAILGAFMGRKRLSASSTSQISTAIKRAGRVGKQGEDIRHAKEVISEIQTSLEELNTQFEEEISKLDPGL